MKRPSLFGSPAARQTEAPLDETRPAQPVATPPAATRQGRGDDARRYPLASTREGKRAATAYLDPEAWKQLQIIALDEETTIQALLTEGINHVFEKRGKSRLA